MAGYRGYYVPESVALSQGLWHVRAGAWDGRNATFLPAATRLIFMWKNMGGARLLGPLFWLPIRFWRLSCYWGGLGLCGGFLGAIKRMQVVEGGPACARGRAGGMDEAARGVLSAFRVR